MKMMNYGTREVCELVKAMFPIETKEYEKSIGMSDDEELKPHEIEDILYNKCDITLDQFDSIIEKLLPLCEHVKSELTGTAYRGFGKDGVWLIRQEV